ncbi:MAG: hypothetical protein IPH06_09945 [Alphaproteobacteria bacterium]|nr:hypothetical protein [Alphaproteobacteria bacterium]QQS58311.1 MAG: hypothetical protein IPN28_05700 [Alphaproteobacteria bacterium]
MLDPEYIILAKRLEDGVPDSSGFWLVKSEVELTEKIKSLNGFSHADTDDEEYFKSEAIRVFALSRSLDGYILYRASFPLGKGTICSAQECNLYLLIKKGSSEAFINIFII